MWGSSRYPPHDIGRSYGRHGSRSTFGPRNLARNVLMVVFSVVVIVIMVLNRQKTTIKEQTDAQEQINRLMDQEAKDVPPFAKMAAEQVPQMTMKDANLKAMWETFGLGSMSTEKGYNSFRPNEKKKQIGKEKAALVVLARYFNPFKTLSIVNMIQQ